MKASSTRCALPPVVDTTESPADRAGERPSRAGSSPVAVDPVDRSRAARQRNTLLAVAVIAVAANLRAPMTSVPPLIPRMEADLGLSGASAGAITMVPVLSMGLLAPLGQRLGQRLGDARAIGLAMAVLLVGTVVRAASGGGASGLALLYFGTLLVGAGVAISGALLPAVVKGHYASRAGLMTGVTMGAMSVSAAVGALVAVPLAAALGSWQMSLATWALPALVASLLWRAGGAGLSPARRSTGAPRPSLPWAHPTAWILTGYLLMQSTQFYTTTAWIPATYHARGWSAAEAGVLLTAFAATQGLAGATLPALADRVRDKRLLLAPCSLSTLAGISGVALFPDALPYVWMACIGFGLGGGFGMGLVYLVEYASGSEASARLTAMVFLFSYAAASLGPVWFGALGDATGSFEKPWLVLMGLALVQAAYFALLSPARRLIR